MDDLLREFLMETAESLAVLDSELVQFEQSPEDKAILGNIFRLVHTIKGTCGFLGLPRLESVAHAGENVLGKFREGKLAVTPQSVGAILTCIDAIRGLLAALEDTGAEPAGDDAALIALLCDVAEGRAAAPAAAPVAAAAVAASVELVGAVADAPGFPVAAELLEEVAAARDVREPAVETPVREVAPAAPPVATAKSAEVGETKDLSVAQQSIRVSVDTLESLMNLVSELVLTRNQLLQMVRGRADNGFAAPLQRLSHITSELQEGVMKTRMQPIGNAWAKLPRIVRDLAHETGKRLHLQMHGEATELDRQVLELIKDPLTHMVRNAADHGIEPGDERRRAGKPEAGTIRLSAHHEGGHIIIEVSDDGRGLDVERIRRKAIANGLASESELAQMSAQQIYQFVFRAGFSTAEKVTNVSGRGVGMDVVRTNVEKIGGTVELQSAPGKGSTFIIKIPLTLAIVSGLIVAAGGQRFALPQICVVELVWVNGAGETRIETLRETPLLRLRDRLLPLVDLRRLLRIDAEATAATTEGGSVFVIVTQVGNIRFGIIVDEVFDTEEIVVKPVAPLMRNISYYAGNTILGDGGVVMILDPNGIAQSLGQDSAGSTDKVVQTEQDEGARTRLLVFRAGGVGLKAVPLELIARLEEVDLAEVERSQGRHMIQYRGHLMPLVPSDTDFEWAKEGKRPILVFTDHGHSMGLVVEEIVDIVEQHLVIEVGSQGAGLVGSAVINGRATEIIDAAYYLTQAFPDWFEAAGGRAHGETTRPPRLLLIEDSAFFRGLLKPLLEAEGYDVTVVGDADHALKLREDGIRFDAVVSDIELPGMSGFDFADNVRHDDRWREVPLLALSAYASDRDLVRGRAVGFTDYIAKFDRDGLMASLARNLGEMRA